MNPRTAPLLLAVGVVLGSAFSLENGVVRAVPALGLGAWAIAFAASWILVKTSAEPPSSAEASPRDGFRRARAGSALGIFAMAVLLVGSSTSPEVLALLAIGLGMHGSATGLGAAVAEPWRSAAGARLARVTLAVVLVLGVLVVIDLAGIGPSWAELAVRVAHAVTILIAVWLAAYAVASREALATGGATA